MIKWPLLILALFLAAPAAGQTTDQPAGQSPVQLVHESREALGDGNLDRALARAAAAVAADPAYAEAWKQQGRVQMLRGEYTDALASFETVLELTPNDADVRTWIPGVLLELGRGDSMADVLSSLNESELDRLDPTWYADAVNQLLERGDDRNAFRVTARIADVYKEETPLIGARDALRSLNAGDPDAARQALLTADSKPGRWAPLLAAVWSGVSRAYMQAGRPTPAIPAQQRALQLRAHWTPAVRDLGWAYRRSGQAARAADTWERGIEQAGGGGGWWLWIAEARFDAGEWDAAARAAGRALEYEPDKRHARTVRLAALIRAGDTVSATRMQEALAGDPAGQRTIVMAEAMVALDSGNPSGAAAKLETLRDAAPDDPEVRRMLAKAYAAWAAAETGADTIPPLEKLVALDPERAGAWRDLGWGYWVAEREQEALDAWNRAVQQGVAQPERLAAQVAALLVEQGRTREAIATYQRWFPDTGLLGIGRQLVDAGLLSAAEPVLLEAWEKGEHGTSIGVALGYAEARNGICVELPERFSAVMPRLEALPPGEVDKVLTALATCADDPGTRPLMDTVLADLGGKPEYKTRLAGLLLQAAESDDRSPDRGRAFELYRESLETDPDQPGVWLRAATLGYSLDRVVETDQLLADVSASTGSMTVRRGIRGYRAARAGRLADAIADYRRSLDAAPDQPELRMALFDALMSLERYEDAQDEADWFVSRWLDGDTRMRSYLAEIRSAFGQGPEALQHWQALYLSYPDTPYYGVEAARTLFNLCRAGEATRMLEQITTLTPDPRAYELLGEIALALGHPDEALHWADLGLEHDETASLWRIRAEAAESAGEPATARVAAESLLARDPGNVHLSRLLGRALLSLGEREAAESHFSALLERNEYFVPALVRLKDFASERGDTDEALGFAARLRDQRPWDAGDRRRYGVALAEDERFGPALDVLREEADRPPEHAVPILVYDGVTACDYPGRTTARQITRHIARLNDEGYRFGGIEALQQPENKTPTVVLMVTGADPESLERIDEALAGVHGRAVYALTGIERSRAHIRAMLETDRWDAASAGPADAGPGPIDESGTRGNNLTHALYRDGKAESNEAVRDRLDQSIARAAASIPKDETPLLYYPGGDYGQLSLDTDESALEALRSAVSKHFILAVAGDDDGYATLDDPDLDPLRLPARIVPPGWDDEDLIDHLRQQQPATQGTLQLAKALFWQAQHERADQRFSRAEAAGADPREVYFHWGANAYREGDLPTALEKLRIARKLEPDSERVGNALKAAKWRRRPLLELQGLGWKDSDYRSFKQLGAALSTPVNDRLRLELFADRDRWQRDVVGEEEGTRLGIGGRWYYSEGHRLDARLWRMDLENVNDHIGGYVNVHLPLAAWSGALDAYARREQIETVEAVRGEILRDTAGLSLHTRIRDMWDLYADPSLIHRSDDNDGWMLEGRLVRRLAEWPFLGVGYRYRFGDSDEDPPEYWAPESLRQHQLYATWRGDNGPWYYNLSAEAGYARETATDWRFVWGGRARIEYTLSRRINLSGELRRLETPDYDRTDVMLGIDLRF